MLDTHRLRLLREFAERGTISATAAALGYTPSAVSQQLAALERESGAVLLDRTARTAELTDAGRRLVEHAERILAMVEAAEADLSSAGPTGRVTVTAFPTAAVAFGPALVRRVRAHPGMSLLLRETQREEGLRLVRSGEVDVALIADWSGRLTRPGPGSSRTATRRSPAASVSLGRAAIPMPRATRLRIVESPSNSHGAGGMPPVPTSSRSTACRDGSPIGAASQGSSRNSSRSTGFAGSANGWPRGSTSTTGSRSSR